MINRPAIFFAAFAIHVAVATVSAEESFGGGLQATGWIALQGVAANEPLLDRRRAIGGRGRLELAFRREALEAALKIERPSDANLGDDTADSLVREAWIRYSTDWLELIVGRQLLPEGRSDWLRPQGQFAPRDYREITVINAEQRVGLPALRLDLYPTPDWTLTLAVVEHDRGNNFITLQPLPVSSWRPLRHPAATGGLGRLEWRKDIWELGASIARNRSLFPALDEHGKISAYDQNRLGFDGSANLDGTILRWDAAMIRNDTARFGGLPKREIFLSLGLDKGVWTDGTAFLQWIRRKALHAEPDGNDPAGTINRALSQYFRQKQDWISLNLRQQLAQKSDMEFGCLYGFHHDVIAFLKYGYNVADGWRVNAQYQMSRGGTDTLAGNFTPGRISFIEIRRFF